MHVKREKLAWLAKAVVATLPEEIDCEEWLSRVGRLVELQRAREPITPDLKPVQQHMDVCQECAEDFQALIQGLAED